MDQRPKRVPVKFIPASPAQPPTPPAAPPQSPTPSPAPVKLPPVAATPVAPPKSPTTAIPSEPPQPVKPVFPVSTASDSPGKMHWIWHVLVSVVLAIMVWVTYSNSFQSLWTLDNKYIIQLDPRNKLATYDNFSLVWTQDYWWPKGISGLYRPIPTLSYMLNWSQPFSWDPPEAVVAWAVPDKLMSRGAYAKWRENITRVAGFDPEAEPQKFNQVVSVLSKLQNFPALNFVAPDKSNPQLYEQWREQVKAVADFDPEVDPQKLALIAGVKDRRINRNRTDLPDPKPYDTWRGLVLKIAGFDPAAEPWKMLLVNRLRAGEIFTWDPPSSSANPDLYVLWLDWVKAVAGFDPDKDPNKLLLVRKFVSRGFDEAVPDREKQPSEYARWVQRAQETGGFNAVTEPEKLAIVERVFAAEKWRKKTFSWDNEGKEKGTPQYSEWASGARLHGGIDPDTDPARLQLARICQAGRGAGVRTIEWLLSWAPRSNGPRVDGTQAKEEDQVYGFHWVNLIFHYLNVVLVYFLTLRVVKRFWVAVFTAALFGVHPIGTESITNIIGRADLFATFSVLGVLLLHIRQAESGGWRRVGYFVLMTVLLLFGLFSKESAFAVIFVILLYDIAMRLDKSVWKLNPLGLIPALVLCVTTLIIPRLHNLYFGSADPNKPETIWPIVGLYVAAMAMMVARMLYLAMPKDSLVNRGIAMTFALLATLFLGSYYTPAFFLLPLLIVLDEFVTGTALGGLGGRNAEWRDAGRPFVHALLPYLLLIPPILMMFFVRKYVFFASTPPEEPFLDNPLRGIGFMRSRMTAVNVMARQIWLLICPVNLSSDYSFDQIPLFTWDLTKLSNLASVILLFVFTAIVLGALWMRYKGHRAIFFFVFLFFLNYGPTGNFLLIIGSIMAERFMYLPLIGFAGIAVLGIDTICRQLKVGFDLREDEDPKRAPWWRFAPHVIVASLLIACGTRAYFRNFAWREDLSLWEEAIKISPRSFRCYQSLAFALFEKSPQLNIDRMIALDEKGFELVDRLPDEKNSSRLYLHLGMYYTIKGDLTCKQGSDGNPIVTPEAKGWYEKAAGILERGSRIDRTFNEVNRKRDVDRGKAKTPDEVADVGLSPVYSYMGLAYIKAGRMNEARQAFRYALHLDPNDVDSYIRTAQIFMMQGQPDRAAVPLLQAIVVNETRMDAWQLLTQIYNSINPQGSPAAYVQGPDGRPKLNIQNELVKNHLCSAYREFTRAFILAKREDTARQSANVAKNSYGFPASLFDPIFTEKLERPTPPTPVFYDPAKQPPPIEP